MTLGVSGKQSFASRLTRSRENRSSKPPEFRRFKNLQREIGNVIVDCSSVEPDLLDFFSLVEHDHKLLIMITPLSHCYSE